MLLESNLWEFDVCNFELNNDGNLDEIAAIVDPSLSILESKFLLIKESKSNSLYSISRIDFSYYLSSFYYIPDLI